MVAKAELAQSYKAQAMIGFLALVAGIIPFLFPVVGASPLLGRMYSIAIGDHLYDYPQMDADMLTAPVVAAGILYE